MALSKQLDQYFTGQRVHFDVPTRLIGTEFQQKVWQNLRDIPYGRTLSYAAFASHVGGNMLGAVSGNIGRNPLPLLYPCHRVVSKLPNAGGFAGGMNLKEYLFELEREYYQQASATEEV